MSAEQRMTSRERDTILVMIRQRERVARDLTGQRAAELTANFDAQMQSEYYWQDDDRWREAVKTAYETAKAGQEQIERRCHELGIPKRFRPRLTTPYWVSNDVRSKTTQERAELRRAALTQIDAIRKTALTEIRRRSVEAQEAVLLPSLTSQEAKALVASIPSATDLMPQLKLTEIQKLIGKAPATESDDADD